jgi:hypothetical protein
MSIRFVIATAGPQRLTLRQRHAVGTGALVTLPCCNTQACSTRQLSDGIRLEGGKQHHEQQCQVPNVKRLLRIF